MLRGSMEAKENMLMRTAPSLTLFDKLWSERTIILGQGMDGRGVPLLPMMGGGQNVAPFPMTVQATLMDSALVAEGIREFGRLASMNDAELIRFDSLYHSVHNDNGYLYVWAEIRTTSTEDFLQLDKWTIYLENDQGRQLEPGRIVASPIMKDQSFALSSRGGVDQARGPRQGSELWTPSVRDVELYFPLQRKGEEAFLNPGDRNLKFIMLENTNPAVRAEGMWLLSMKIDSEL